MFCGRIMSNAGGESSLCLAAAFCALVLLDLMHCLTGSNTLEYRIVRVTGAVPVKLMPPEHVVRLKKLWDKEIRDQQLGW
jgi:hypothetical protein